MRARTEKEGGEGMKEAEEKLLAPGLQPPIRRRAAQEPAENGFKLKDDCSKQTVTTHNNAASIQIPGPL